MAAKNKHGGHGVGVGIGVTAAMLAAAGGYFLYGAKNAKQNRAKVKSWSLKAKADVLDGIEKAKHLSEEDYSKLVDNAVKGYKAARSASATEIHQFAKEMKKYWKDIKKKGAPVKQAAPKKKK